MRYSGTGKLNNCCRDSHANKGISNIPGSAFRKILWSSFGGVAVSDDLDALSVALEREFSGFTEHGHCNWGYCRAVLFEEHDELQDSVFRNDRPNQAGRQQPGCDCPACRPAIRLSRKSLRRLQHQGSLSFSHGLTLSGAGTSGGGVKMAR